MTDSELTHTNYLSGDLDGSTDVQLAPIKGEDVRRSLPAEFFQRRPYLFTRKLILAFLLIGGGVLAIQFALTKTPTWYSVLIGCGGFVLCGLMYAHLIELQHECLHCHVFRRPCLNRLAGVVAGAFMLISYSHYRYDHLRHHAYLGTHRNVEHFNYRFNGLNSIFGFLRAFFDLNRYITVGSLIACSWKTSEIEGVAKSAQRHIKQEYRLYSLLLIIGGALSYHFQTVLIVAAWWLPALIVAEGTHFLIEMPEHYGLNTQSAADVFENSRTIKTNWLVAWFVNGNHSHTAHHFHHGVPMCNLKRVHLLIEPRIKTTEKSYTRFFRDVISGKITHRADTSCMTR